MVRDCIEESEAMRLSSSVKEVIVGFRSCDERVVKRFEEAEKEANAGNKCVSLVKSSHGRRFSSSLSSVMLAKALRHRIRSVSVTVVSLNLDPL